MSAHAISTRIAIPDDIGEIVSISARVQDTLTAAGSQQHIGPLSFFSVTSAVQDERCFVATEHTCRVLGCAMIRPIDEKYFASSAEFSITNYPRPWQYLHSMMLLPEAQGKGYGLAFLGSVIKMLQSDGGTVFLDCWTRNEKLKAFYTRAGCQYATTLPEAHYEIAVFVRPISEVGRIE